MNKAAHYPHGAVKVVHQLWMLWLLFPISTLPATPQLAAAWGVSCAIDNGGRLYCWGDDSHGQLAQNRLLYSSTPLRLGDGYALPSTSAQTVIGGGLGHAVAIKADGSLWAWGLNDSGQVGDGTIINRTIGPAQIGSEFKSVSAGWYHNLAIKGDGSLWAWGASRGGIGDGVKSQSLVPMQIGSDYMAASAGYEFSLAVKTDGSLWAWGYNGYGQLGDGTSTDSSVPKLIGTGYTAIVAGFHDSLALKADGSLWAWGLRYQSTLPKQIGSGYKTFATACGAAMALKFDGSVWAWGYNYWTGATTDTPTQIDSGYAAIAVGCNFGFGLKSDGSLWSWGRNNWGQLGDGTNADRATPTQIGADYAAIAAAYNFALGIKNDGSLWAWGENQRGEVAPSAPPYKTLPAYVGADYVAVVLGSTHALAVKNDGSLWAWGSNDSFQLGDSTNTPSAIPKQIGTGYKALAAGGLHSLGVKTDGSLWQWGYNNPLVTQIGTDYKAIAAGGDNFSIGLKNDGSLWSWGANEKGQLGDGTTTDGITLTPKQIGTDFAAIAVGSFFGLGLKNDGSLWSWGGNDSGQLGDGTTTTRSLPEQIGTGYAAIAAGWHFGMGLKNDGGLWAWGATADGRFADGSTDPSLVPKLVGTGYAAISGGYDHILATKADGSVWAWGWNAKGQLGDGTFAQRPSPVLVVNEKVDGFLNLNPGIDFEVPPSVGVPFFVVASGGISDASASLSTTTKFNPPDVGNSGAVFVTATVPQGSLVPAQSSLSALSASGVGAGTEMRLYSSAAIPANPFVLINLTSSGWQPVMNGQLMPYASGVLGDQLAAQTILSNTNTTNLKGAQFCVGYGTSAERMIAAGAMRVVASIGNPSAAGATAPSCIVGGPRLSFSLPLSQGWNLLGNSLNQSLSVATLYGDANKVTTVWKWDAATSAWQFYTPHMDAAALLSYASGKGYGVLSEIKPGEGYWVNAKAQVSPATQSGDSFILTAAGLVKGWNLVATGSDIGPAEFNRNLKASVVPADLVTLWAWDNPTSAWYFYAPALEAKGGSALTDYIAGKGYLDFVSNNKKLGNGTGFWVNR